MTDIAEKPNTIPWPPIITIALVLAAWLLHTLFPIDWISGFSASFWLLGIALIIIALAVDVWAFRTFKAADTTIMPNQGTKNLVTHGPFAWSRNPIYVGNVVLVIGIAIASGNTWMLLAAALTALLINNLAILREEAHLKANFAEEWNAYAAKVRRWI